MATTKTAREGLTLPPRLTRGLRQETWLRSFFASTWGPALVIVGLSLAISLYRLGDPSLWMDEAFAVERARQPLPIVWYTFTGGWAAYMFLYTLLLDGWLHLTGWMGLAPTEFVIRLPSALCTALSSGVVYLLGRRFINPLAGLAGALLYLVNPWQVSYGVQARSYGLLLLLSALAWYALLAALTEQTPRKRWWISYVILSVLATYAQILNLVLVLAQVILFICLFFLPTAMRSHIRGKWLPLLLSLLGIGILVAPQAWVSRGRSSPTGWLVPIGPAALPGELAHWYFGTATKAAAIVLLALAALGGFLTLLLVLLRGRPWLTLAAQRFRQHTTETLSRLWLGTIAALCWFLVPILAAFLVSQTDVHLVSSRYLVDIVPAICLLLAIGVMALPTRSLRWAVFASLLGVQMLGLFQYYDHAQLEDWRTPARWIEERYQPGDGLVSYNNARGCELSLEAYFHSDGSIASFPSDSPGIMSWPGMEDGQPFRNTPDALDVQKLAHFAAAHPRIIFIAGLVSGPDESASVQRVIDWLDIHYTFVEQLPGNGTIIRIYQTQGAASTAQSDAQLIT